MTYYTFAEWYENNVHDVDKAIEWLKTVDPALDPDNVAIDGTDYNAETGHLTVAVYRRKADGSKVLANHECCQFHMHNSLPCRDLLGYDNIDRPYWAKA